MSVHAVVATGLGAIGPWGADVASLTDALAAGRPLAGLVPEVDVTRWLPAASARRLGRPSRWAVAAARIALEHAGVPSLEGRRVAEDLHDRSPTSTCDGSRVAAGDASPGAAELGGRP